MEIHPDRPGGQSDPSSDCVPRRPPCPSSDTSCWAQGHCGWTGHHHPYFNDVLNLLSSFFVFLCLLLASIDLRAVLAAKPAAGAKNPFQADHNPSPTPTFQHSKESVETSKCRPAKDILFACNPISHFLRRTFWMCLELSRIAHNLSPSCHTLEDTLVFDSADGIESFQSEFSQRGPKRKQILLWQCCQCGQGGNPIRYDNCCNCHYPRCAYCPVRKVRA